VLADLPQAAERQDAQATHGARRRLTAGTAGSRPAGLDRRGSGARGRWRLGALAVEQAVAHEHRPYDRELLLGCLDEWQAQAADLVAEQVQRGLGAGGVGGQKQGLV